MPRVPREFDEGHCVTQSIDRDLNISDVEFPVLGRAFAEKVLDRLSYYNVGKTEDSNIMIIDPAAVVYKRPRSTGPHDIPMKHFQKFVNSLKSRLTVAQVYHAISNQGNFNFNYLCFLICAAVVADIALVTNSAACVFASMLLSPVMKIFVCLTTDLSGKCAKASQLCRGVRLTLLFTNWDIHDVKLPIREAKSPFHGRYITNSNQKMGEQVNMSVELNQEEVCFALR
ncbi:hypothetical protein ACTXT7_014148 [Hymenolepis weldensis]